MAAAAAAGTRRNDEGRTAEGRTAEAPAAAAAATKNANLRRVDRLDGRPFRTQFDARFELDLTPVSNSI